MKNKAAIIISSNGPDGNIFAILAKARQAMQVQQPPQDFNSLFADVQNCKSYADAIARIKQDIELIDLDGKI